MTVPLIAATLATFVAATFIAAALATFVAAFAFVFAFFAFFVAAFAVIAFFVLAEPSATTTEGSADTAARKRYGAAGTEGQGCGY